VFVDGFNVYHRLEEYRRRTGKNLKWLDYAALFNSLTTDEQQIAGVHFFTSVDGKRTADVIERHENYIGALRASSLQIHHGVFKYKEEHCKQCQYQWVKPQEKETDVRIAVKALEFAHSNQYDTCWLMTGDTDLVPFVQSYKTMFPQKEIQVLLPPVYNKARRHLNHIADKTYAQKAGVATLQIGFNKLAEYPLPAVVTDAKGRIFKNPYATEA
jgi:uncharacterized LabA/DUF88 family protein